MKLPIESIRIDLSLSARQSLNQEKIAEYCEILDSMPNIKVVDIDGEYWLGGGFHRYHAAKQLGRESIECDVIKGDRRDLLWVAMTDNVGHGLCLTRQERDAAICRLLRENFTQQDIADEFGLSRNRISEIGKKNGLERYSPRMSEIDISEQPFSTQPTQPTYQDTEYDIEYIKEQPPTQQLSTVEYQPQSITPEEVKEISNQINLKGEALDQWLKWITFADTTIKRYPRISNSLTPQQLEAFIDKAKQLVAELNQIIESHDPSIIEVESYLVN